MKKLSFEKFLVAPCVLLTSNAALAFTTVEPVPVPEPSSFALLAIAVATMVYFRKRK